jgi:nicotinamidase-related amidase
MTQLRTVLLSSSLLLALCGGVAQAQSNKPIQTLQMPAMPDPARITLNSKTTALMVLDYVEDICATQPKCKSQMLPAMTPFMEWVRKAGLVVAYGTRAQNMAHWLPQVAPAEGDIKIVNTAQDRFYNTDLDKLLKAQGITTMIMVGWKVSGSVTYTSVGAMIRDYTVVIPVDTTRQQRLRNSHRLLQCTQFRQCQSDERAFEAKIRNAEPHGPDRLPVRDHQGRVASMERPPC